MFPDVASTPASAGINDKLRGLLEDAFIGEAEGAEGEEEVAVVAPKKAKPLSAGKELMAEIERARAQRGGGSGKKET